MFAVVTFTRELAARVSNLIPPFFIHMFTFSIPRYPFFLFGFPVAGVIHSSRQL